MSLVDVETGEFVEDLEASSARRLTDQIKITGEGLWHLVTEAYVGRAWRSLGYSSWDDYCTREFGNLRLRLPREERQEVIVSLRESGLSIRAIAAATGETRGTTERVINSGVPHGTPDEEPEPVTGTDGKQYRRNTQPKPTDEDRKVAQRTGVSASTVAKLRREAEEAEPQPTRPSTAARPVEDDDPVRQRTLAALERWESCPTCEGKGMVRKETG